jgi:hypothetical protein
MQGDPETGGPRGSGWGVDFTASFFVYCLRAEMPFRCRQEFPGEEKCLLDLPRNVLQDLFLWYWDLNSGLMLSTT